ncbi:SDR family oxidoreductase [Alloiococcus sp. CFN-8]|uniref:SDR family oxidoreductase n=1 Tax=Alloiococcus sp. CFN-8 TaxID=3416081 RepID=UPI003CEF5428
MNILVTGANGNTGKYMVKYFSKGHNVIGFDRKELDVCNSETLLRTIENQNPDIVIHTAGISDIDLCERDETYAYKVNTLGTLNIAKACDYLNIPLVYLSTSYVFNGMKTSPYIEEDYCDPINTFGKTKLAAEKLIRTVCKKHYIIRTSWIFGGYNCYIKNIIKNDPLIILSTKEIISPTYIEDLCFAIDFIIKQNSYGIFNCVNGNYSSKIDVISFVLEASRLNKKVVEIPKEYLSDLTPRPRFSALSTSLIEKEFKLSLPSWQESIYTYISLL